MFSFFLENQNGIYRLSQIVIRISDLAELCISTASSRPVKIGMIRGNPQCSLCCADLVNTTGALQTFYTCCLSVTCASAEILLRRRPDINCGHFRLTDTGHLLFEKLKLIFEV
jgi:hypothetical protein